MTNRILKRCGTALLVFVVLVALGGCTQKGSDENASNTNPPSQAQRQTEPALPPPQAAPPPEAVPPPPTVPPQRQKARSTAPEETRPTATTGSVPQKPAAPSAQKSTPKDVVVLVGSPMGGVRFEHKKHVGLASNKCETCHHPSRPQKPLTAPQQTCTSCHTKVATPPMKTKLQAAFHNPTAQAGTCINCHKTQAAKSKKVPVKCADCHKKENK